MKTLQFWSKRISKRTGFCLSRTFIYTRVLTALFDKEKIIRSTPPTQFSKEFIKMTTTKTTKEFFDPGGHCSIATISHHYTIIPDPRPTMTFILRTDPSLPPKPAHFDYNNYQSQSDGRTSRPEGGKPQIERHFWTFDRRGSCVEVL